MRIVVFTVVCQAKDIEVHISAPENNDRSALVTYVRAGDSFALLMGHLYYRADRLTELMTVCSLDHLRECQVNDAALVLAAYRHLGLASLERLEGDFALVIWDAETRQFIGLRDPLGGYPLFWIQHKDMIALSTSLQPLCALLPQCVLNEEYCAEFVMLQAPRGEMNSEQCAFIGIHRVLPGTMVIANADANTIESRTYWDWHERIKDPGSDDVTEVAEQYCKLLRAAIQERMKGRTIAHLSGGMDSTSIALLAQDIICSGIGEAPLHTASLVYDCLPLLAQERPYIESVLQQERQIVGHQISADDLLDFDIFADPPPHDEPFAALASYTTQQPIATLAAKIGGLTILTGHGADEIHHLLPYYLTDLLRQHRFRQIWRETTKWAKGRNCSPWSVLMTFGLSPILSTWIAGSRWADILTKKDADWSIPPWIMSDFARRHALRSRAIESARQIYRQHQSTSLSVTLDAIRCRAGDMFRWSVITPLGISYAHPFLDPRLLTFGLGMQLRILPDPGAMKPVLAEAMRDRLPDAIRSRQRKNGFSEVYYLGLARNLPNLETIVRLAPIDGMIDKDVLIKNVQEASLAGFPPRGLQRMNYTLSMLKWLNMQQEWQCKCESVFVTHHIDV
jgi:asparagine synthase (glutamine-hydrolysing)